MPAGFVRQRQKGFTLVELMITVVIMAILLAAAAPGFRELLDRNRMQSAASNVYTTLMLARSEALKRNEDVVVLCKESDGSRCTVGGTDGDWKHGWLVYPVSDPNDIIAERKALGSGDTLWLVDDPNDSSPGKFDDLAYQPNGGASDEVFFVLCNSDANTDSARQVSVEVTGRPKMHESSKNCTY